MKFRMVQSVKEKIKLKQRNETKIFKLNSATVMYSHIFIDLLFQWGKVVTL